MKFTIDISYLKTNEYPVVEITSKPRVFLIGFLRSLDTAHLVSAKEQSSEEKNESVHSNRFTDGRSNWDYTVGLPFFYIHKTSIKQFLTVLAMSVLTTGDLEITSIRIVPCLVDHQSINRSPTILGREEMR